MTKPTKPSKERVKKEFGLMRYIFSIIEDLDRVHKAELLAKEEEVNDRWINQPANEHDNRIREANDKKWRLAIKKKLTSMMEVPEDKFFGKSEFDNVYEAYRIIILGEALDSLLERKHG